MPILDRLNKGEAVKTAKQVPYRLRQGVKSLSYGDADSENMLIPGGAQGAAAALCGQGEAHLHRPALQHQIGL